MLMTITLEREPASELGYLLHKHPQKFQSFSLNFGIAHVFYPEVHDHRCTVALLLEIDQIAGVRSGAGFGSFDHYVSDRPYVASSLLSVAIAQVFGTAMSGRCRERPEMVDLDLPFTVHIPVLPSRSGDQDLIRKLFSPLGYEIQIESFRLDEQFPQWGTAPYFGVVLRNRLRLQDLLTHLYVLIPVLDGEKHYWVGDDEVRKLLRHGSNWLANHPERERITKRYLRHQRQLVNAVMSQLEAGDASADAGELESTEEALENTLRLHDIRLRAVREVLKASRVRQVLDCGCGDGKLLRLLLEDPQFERIVGVDVSVSSLETASSRLRTERLIEPNSTRFQLLHGSLMYRDQRWLGFDALALVEVIEHIELEQLGIAERNIFEFAKPPLVIITTPNREYNGRFPGLPSQQFRHRDHRFEWTRPEFQSWCERVCDRFAYHVQIEPIGPTDAEVGGPSQMAIFRKR